MKTLIIGEVNNNELSSGTLEIISKAKELNLDFSVITIGNSESTVTIGDNMNVLGNLSVQGVTTTVNSVTVTIYDPVLTLGGDTAPTFDDSLDRGIEFRYYDTIARIGFMGFDNSSFLQHCLRFFQSERRTKPYKKKIQQ